MSTKRSRPTSKQIDELCLKISKSEARVLHLEQELTDASQLAEVQKKTVEQSRLRIAELEAGFGACTDELKTLNEGNRDTAAEKTRLRNALQVEKDLNRQLKAQVDDKFQLPPMDEFNALKAKVESQRQIIEGLAGERDYTKGRLEMALLEHPSAYRQSLENAERRVLYAILKKGVDRMQGGELPTDPEPGNGIVEEAPQG